MLGEQVVPSADAGLHPIFGASCGCVDQMEDYRSSFKQVEQFVHRELEKNEVHEMQTTTNYIAKMSDIESLDDLIDAADRTATAARDILHRRSWYCPNAFRCRHRAMSVFSRSI